MAVRCALAVQKIKDKLGDEASRQARLAGLRRPAAFASQEAVMSCRDQGSVAPVIALRDQLALRQDDLPPVAASIPAEQRAAYDSYVAAFGSGASRHQNKYGRMVALKPFPMPYGW